MSNVPTKKRDKARLTKYKIHKTQKKEKSVDLVLHKQFKKGCKQKANNLKTKQQAIATKQYFLRFSPGFTTYSLVQDSTST